MSEELLKENEDYQLIPNDNDGWDIRILQGDYVETVFNFGKIMVMEDEESLSFDFSVVSTPDPDLTSENEGLQNYVGSVLLSVITESLKEKE
jgi:hypothetical protein